MVLAFATNFPASAFNPSISLNSYSLNTPTPTISSTHFTLLFNLFICTICDGDAFVHPCSLFFFPSLPFLLLFLFFLIPTEWNPLRRGGGCNRLTICYYSTCSSHLPCIFFPNAIVYSVSLFPFRIVAGLGCSFQPLALSPAAFLVSLVIPRSNKLFAFVYLAPFVFVDPLVKES